MKLESGEMSSYKDPSGIVRTGAPRITAMAACCTKTVVHENQKPLWNVEDNLIPSIN